MLPLPTIKSKEICYAEQALLILHFPCIKEEGPYPQTHSNTRKPKRGKNSAAEN